ncbi:ATPase MORC2-like isoform X2 [Watersipora subatra]|uniref:ATPase MORC2-like isoform X2 n=1 Tax=Watersipora subatra TaxID=2589382 RepID=UPI00355BB3F5
MVKKIELFLEETKTIMDEYNNLNTASLDTEYLMTNATTHSFIFGAMAELVDNARDAKSTKLEIYTMEGEEKSCNPLLCFKDDGCGMSKEEAENVLIFGSSQKTVQEEPIGMYGNGLKSGSMRLGKDMILFTKKDDVCTCLMISRTFYQAENVTQIKVPVPAFHASTKTMVGTDKKKHSTEVQLITKYSPFKTEQALFKQFNSIKEASGTIIIVYNLSTTPNGELELDFKSDPLDMKASINMESDVENDMSDVIERRSFRAYCSILYKSPRMKIILQNRRVRTRLLAFSLYLPKRILVNYKSFKNQSEKQVNEAKKQIDVAKRKLIEVQSQISQLSKSTSIANKSHMIQLRKLQNVEAELSQQLSEKKGIMELRKKQSKKSEQLEFYFGLNANERYHDGLFFYNADRLIKMYVKEGTLQSKEEITYRGIIGVVSVPKSSLLPTHNKQDFNDHAEYKKLRKTVDQAMQQYWEEVVMGEWAKRGLLNLWAELGYTNDWRKPPSEDEKFKIRRARMVKHLQQCDKCLKWRVIPYHKNYLYKDFPDNWQCLNSLDPASNSCSKPEQLPKIDSSALKHKSLLKPPDVAATPPAKRDAPSKKMSAAQQEQIRLEERKRKAAEEAAKASAQKKSKPSVVKDSVPVKSKPTPPRAASPIRRPPTAVTAARASSSRISSTSASNSSSKLSSPPSVNNKTAVSTLPGQVKEASPELPPMRVTRRSSPARTVKKQEPSTPSMTTPTRASRSSHNNIGAVTSEPPEPSGLPESMDTSTDSSKPSPKQSSVVNGNMSISAIKVETATPRSTVTSPKKAEIKWTPKTTPKYRVITIADLTTGELEVGNKVQGRYQNKWQDAEVLEIRPDNVLVKYKSKISLAMKVKNPEKNIEGELRIETEEEEDLGEMSQPSSTTIDESFSTPSSQYSTVHHKKLTSLVKSLDRSLDVDSLSLSNLADLDVLALLNRYTSKVKKEAAGASLNESRREIDALQSERTRLETELQAQVTELAATNTRWQKRETERFERIRELFSRVLTVCIGAGPESRFTTYEELVSLLENIATSLAD